MGYKAAVQILKQADDLRLKVLRKSDLLTDSQAWTDQQKLQTIYHQALILDLEYALDKKVEQDLWNIGFKNHISVLQELTRDKKNSRRSECQALLTWCLEAASGFYLTLLQELCNVFDIDLPFRRRGNVLGQVNSSPETANLPQSSSCLYICQYCLVHLGDIARYRNQRKQAENFYKQAIMVSPTSGHPYNQLALLEASQGDKLSTVFYYIRGIAVKNPFPVSITNLLSTLNSAVDKDNPLEKIPSKITVNEFVQIYLCTHALLHTATDLPQAKLGVKSLNTTMTALVATQSFTTDKLIKITAINLYALNHVTGNNSETDEMTEDEKHVRESVLDLLAGSLSAFLVPVHTLKCDESLLDYYALPAVKLLLYWIRTNPNILKEIVFTNRLQIWPSLCKLLNNVQQYLKDFDYNQYKQTPLSEDKTLQGFHPLINTFRELDFKLDDLEDKKVENLIRLHRIIDFGLFLTELDINNAKLITKSENGDQIIFDPGCMQPDPTNDLLEEMKSFNVSDLSYKNGKKEKRGGILKPQGSLEKSREERELMSSSEPILLSDLSNASSSSTSSGNGKPVKKRPKQNVALQSIFKKLEENKQVKFNVSETEKEKMGTFDTKTSPPNKSSNGQFNLPPLRTQSFNQNHPAFPLAPPPPPPPPQQQDYLNSLRNMSQLDQNQVSFKGDIPPPNINPQLVVPYTNSQTMFNSSLNTKPLAGYTSHPNFNPPPRGVPTSLYQNVPFPPSSKPIQIDDGPQQNNASWWPNSQNYQRPDNYHMNYSFSNNLLPFVPPPTDFSKPPPPPPNQASGDMFSSPWNNFDGRASFMENNTFDSGMSLRQAMLKEVTNGINTPHNRPINDKFTMQNTSSSPGYSLFNTNSWTPNLMGQLRNPKTSQESSVTHLPQHSLFTGQGPQSLAQLLEQQQSQKHDL